jgi:excisionase family DNA binding protein
MAKIMTVKEVAEYLRIARGTAYKMVRNGQLPAFRIGCDYRLDADAIDRWRLQQQNLVARRNPRQ